MYQVLVVSPHHASRLLLVRALAEPDVALSASADGDEAFAQLAALRPALVVVDLRRPDPDGPVFLGLLRRRHPQLPVISLLPGVLRVSEGEHEEVHDVRSDSPEALQGLLAVLRRSLRAALAHTTLRLLATPVARA